MKMKKRQPYSPASVIKKLFLAACISISIITFSNAQNNFYSFISGMGPLDKGSVTPALNGGYYIAAQEVIRSASKAITSLVLTRVDENGSSYWTKRYGDSFNISKNTPLPVTFTNPVIKTSADGYVYVVSTIKKYPFNGYNNFYSLRIMKLDSLGNKIWMKEIKDNQDLGEIICKDFLVDASGALILTGSTKITDANGDIFVMKVSGNNGSVIWSKATIHTNADVANTITSTADGGFILGGSMASFNGSFYYIAKYDNAGNMQWNKSYFLQTANSPSLAQSVNSITQTLDGGYIFTGSNVYMWDAYWKEPVCVVKLNASGAKQWNTTIDFISSGIQGTNIIQNNDSTYTLCTANNLPGGNIGNVVKLHKDGSALIWSKFTNTNFYQLLKTADNGFVATAIAFGQATGGGYVMGVHLEKFSSIGISCVSTPDIDATSITATTTSPAFTYSLVEMSNRLVLNEYNINRFKNKGILNSSFCTSAIAQAGNKDQLINASENTFKISVYPNPSVGNSLNLVIQGSKAMNAQITVTNADGKTMLSQNSNIIAGTFGKTINIASLPKGIYFLRVSNNNQWQTLKFVKE